MKILIPVDGSKACGEVVEVAEDFGEKYKAELIFLHVIDETTMSDRYFLPGLYGSMEKRGKSILAEVKEEILDYPYEYKFILKRGNPYLEIDKVAEEEDVDLIIMGNRGLGAFSRTLLGSVSNKVLNHSKKSVLLVKPDFDD
ncbi:universal stress protein [Anaerosphaera multitolerans]|uniref:Universal stress protein n=1 Tax=Anaerosphaera multitolerans TaxID=2487351 RepID=A0A437S4C0_9FIRM|nr:universal stress protein [Anaerosphaera multitolerans]RVU53807.1 universal stress protein [Anaerosphaera multitolerans]